MTSDFPSSNLASPECSPLSISAEISQDSLPSKIRLSGIEENDEKEAVLEPVISAQSPTSEPSPTPKITASTPTGFSISPDTSGSSTSFMDSSFPNHPKHAASILLLPPAPSHQQQPRRREEKPHVLPMSHRLSPTLSNVKVLKITNLPWSITSEDLLQWLGNDVKNSLIPIDNQIVSVHILCDRYFTSFFTICMPYLSNSDLLTPPSFRLLFPFLSLNCPDPPSCPNNPTFEIIRFLPSSAQNVERNALPM